MRFASATPLDTAFSFSKGHWVAFAIMWASVVLPQPGGPQKMQLPNLSARMLRRKREFSPTTCRCPINSFITCARIRSAKGAAPVFNVSKKNFAFFYYTTKRRRLQEFAQNKKGVGHFYACAFCEPVCKPSSVLDGHLSRRTVSGTLERIISRRRANACSHFLHRAGFTGTSSRQDVCELLPHISTLARKNVRYISVALSLKSPSPDVIRHPVLCCSDFPHAVTCAQLPARLIFSILIHSTGECQLFFCRARIYRTGLAFLFFL